MSKLLIKKIQLINFISHDETVLSFNEDEKMLIDGVSGAGKSSIVDAFIWGVFGNARVDNKSLVKNGKTDATVKIDLVRGDNEYRIERSTNLKSKNKIEVYDRIDGVLKPKKLSGVKQKQEFIEKKIIGCSYLMFINSVAYPQDNQDNFVKQTASKRKDMILELIRAEDIDSYYEKARIALKEKKLEYESTDNEKKKKETSIKMSEQDLESKIAQLEELGDEDEITVRLNSLTAQNEQKQKKVFELESIIANAQKKADEKMNLERQIKSLEKMVVDVEPIDVNLDELKQQLDQAEQKENERVSKQEIVNQMKATLDQTALKLEQKNQRVVALKNSINSSKEQIEQIKNSIKPCPNVHGQVCTVCCADKQSQIDTLCQKPLEVLKRDEDELDQLLNHELPLMQSEHKEFEDSYNASMSMLDSLEPQHNTIKLIRGQIDNVTSAKAQIEKNEVYEQQIKEKKDAFANIITEDTTETQKELGQVNNEINENAKEIMDCNTALKSIQYMKGGIEERKKEIATLKQELEDLSGEKIIEIEKDIESLELVKEAFSNNGVKTAIIDVFVPKLEENINHVLSQLSDMRIRLSTQRMGAKDRVIEGLFINVVNPQGEEMDINSYSGGEKIKINTSISEGLAMFQNIGFRVWDENIIGFDTETIGGFISVFNSLEHGLDQVVCISHVQQVKDLFNNHVLVRKDGTGTSQLIM